MRTTKTFNVGDKLSDGELEKIVEAVKNPELKTVIVRKRIFE